MNNEYANIYVTYNEYRETLLHIERRYIGIYDIKLKNLGEKYSENYPMIVGVDFWLWLLRTMIKDENETMIKNGQVSSLSDKQD